MKDKKDRTARCKKDFFLQAVQIPAVPFMCLFDGHQCIHIDMIIKDLIEYRIPSCYVHPVKSNVTRPVKPFHISLSM